MSPFELVQTAEPTENVNWSKLKWRSSRKNTILLSNIWIYCTVFSFVAWISDRSKEGFALTYPSIDSYEVSNVDNQHPNPSSFIAIDSNKTCEFF
jgi:hypothetical protein